MFINDNVSIEFREPDFLEGRGSGCARKQNDPKSIVRRNQGIGLWNYLFVNERF